MLESTIHNPDNDFNTQPVPARSKVNWTDAEIEQLRKFVDMSMSAADIAAAMGKSRNAVIGKTHRLGISCKSIAPVTPEILLLRLQRRRERNAHRERVQRIKIKKIMASLAPVPEIIDEQIPLEQRKTILELTNKTCRWPVGDPKSPSFFYCGGPTVDGFKYCSGHVRASRHEV